MPYPDGCADHEHVGTSEQFENPPDAPPASRDAILALDAAVGASVLAALTARAVGRRARGVAKPVVVVVLRPPLVPERFQAGTLLARLAQHSDRGRDEVERQLTAMLDKLVPRVVDAVLARIDMAHLAEGVIAEVDLAEIIRQSTGSVASDTVRGVRMQGISGDEAVGRAVGRIRLRFGRRGSTAPAPADPPQAEPGAAPPADSAVPPTVAEPELTQK